VVEGLRAFHRVGFFRFVKGATMVPATTRRLILNPAPAPDEGIGARTPEQMPRYAAAPPGVLVQRLRQLDREWDVERLTAVASGLLLLGSIQMVSLLGQEWLLMPALIAACLLLQGLFGWTPALPLLRGLGFRTSSEIARERHTLEASRDDLRAVGPGTAPLDREGLSRFENEGGTPAACDNDGAWSVWEESCFENEGGLRERGDVASIPAQAQDGNESGRRTLKFAGAQSEDRWRDDGGEA
jgi:hypothetical protein